MSTKLGHNVCDRKILKEFNYESNWDKMVRVICPLLKNLLYLTFFTLCIYRPVSTKLGQNIYVQQNLNDFDHGSNWTRTAGVFLLLNCEKLLHLTLFTLKHLQIYTIQHQT